MRLLDMIISFCLIICLLPLFCVSAGILKLTGEGEVLYLQPRVGQFGIIFNIIKFATMLKDSPNIGTGNLTVKNDSRILPFGKILRLTKINELPQLINVLKGDMSLVGPRPITPDHYYAYSDAAKAKLCSVRPGLTGIGSIFFRSEENFLDGVSDPEMLYANVITPYKEKLEIWYIDNASWHLYFKVLYITFRVVVMPKNFDFSRAFPSAPNAPLSLSVSCAND